MKGKKKDSRNLHLAFYFGAFVILIIIVSIVFKSIDLVRKSKFDGNHRFTVAVLSQDKTDIISVSPKEFSLSNLEIIGSDSQYLIGSQGIPVDSLVKSDSEISDTAKYFFPKMLLNKRKLQTNLTIVDLIRLSFFSARVDNEKIKKESINSDDIDEISLLSSTLFIDPTISQEKVSIEITNATQISGLGNKLAKYISNMGGNVVLVNSSKDVEEKSQILFREESYTIDKLKSLLRLKGKRNEMNSIADIVIIVGEDRKDF